MHRIVAPKGIQETYKAKIGALDQWVYVRGRNKDNPIILFLHGGPASPSSPSMWMYQRPIEEFLTVVNYDPRGSGRTYLENKPYEASESLTIDQYVSDAIELTEYICKQYGVNKVVLAGWIGLDTAIITIFHIK